MALPKIPRWATLVNFLADASLLPWKSGASPTKVQPPDGLIASGYEPEQPIAAEHENWYRNHVSGALQYAILLTLSTANRGVGTAHPAMVGMKDYFGQDNPKAWCGFSTTANTAIRKTMDHSGTMRSNVNVNYAGAYSGTLGGVNRSIQPTDDVLTLSALRGIVYHAQGDVAYENMSYGFGAMSATAYTLPATNRFTMGLGCKKFDGGELVPTYNTGTQVGGMARRDGGAWTLVPYTVGSVGARNALCTASLFKRKIVGATLQPIFAITQNQFSSGSKCVVVHITNDNALTQTLLYEGAELYGVGYSIWCPPVFDDATGQWIIASTRMDPSSGLSNIDTGFRIFKAGESTPHVASLVCDGQGSGMGIIRLAALGGGFLLAVALRHIGGGASICELILSPDSGKTWHTTGRSFGFADIGHSWTTAIGDTMSHNIYCINVTEDGQANVGGGTLLETGLQDYNAPTHIVIPSMPFVWPLP